MPIQTDLSDFTPPSAPPAPTEAEKFTAQSQAAFFRGDNAEAQRLQAARLYEAQEAAPMRDPADPSEPLEPHNPPELGPIRNSNSCGQGAEREPRGRLWGTADKSKPQFNQQR